MAAPLVLAALRAAAMAQRARVMSKISRIKSTTGAEIKGSRYDVSSTPEKISRYNEKQLRAYLDKGEKFMSRSNQYVSLSNNEPVPRSLAQKYESLQNKSYEKRSQDWAGIKDEKIRPNLTAGELREGLSPTAQRDMKTGYGISRKIPLENVKGISGLKELMKFFRKTLTSKYVNEKRENNRASLITAFEYIGDYETLERVAGLSDKEFDTVWFGNPLAIEAVFAKYSREKSVSEASDKEKERAKRIDVEYDDFIESLDTIQGW